MLEEKALSGIVLSEYNQGEIADLVNSSKKDDVEELIKELEEIDKKTMNFIRK